MQGLHPGLGELNLTTIEMMVLLIVMMNGRVSLAMDAFGIVPKIQSPNFLFSIQL